MPTVSVIRSTVTHNSPFFHIGSHRVTVSQLIGHAAYPQKNGQAELAWVPGSIPVQYTWGAMTSLCNVYHIYAHCVTTPCCGTEKLSIVVT